MVMYEEMGRKTRVDVRKYVGRYIRITIQLQPSKNIQHHSNGSFAIANKHLINVFKACQFSYDRTQRIENPIYLSINIIISPVVYEIIQQTMVIVFFIKRVSSNFFFFFGKKNHEKPL